jgi:hypothetical protein
MDHDANRNHICRARELGGFVDAVGGLAAIVISAEVTSGERKEIGDDGKP